MVDSLDGFLEQQLTTGALKFGQLVIEKTQHNYTITGPADDQTTRETVNVGNNPEQLRDWIRYDSSKRYRPLSGAKTLPTNWQVCCTSLAELTDCLDAIYPLALRELQLQQQGELVITPLDEVLERQSGRYGNARNLSSRARELARTVLCGQCVKAPLWHDSKMGQQIPCPEACSVFVALCNEAALWQSACPAPEASNPAVEVAAFDQPGNELRESFLRRVSRDSASEDCCQPPRLEAKNRN